MTKIARKITITGRGASHLLTDSNKKIEFRTNKGVFEHEIVLDDADFDEVSFLPAVRGVAMENAERLEQVLFFLHDALKRSKEHKELEVKLTVSFE